VADGSKVVINLATGGEDADRVTVAFLVATAAQAKGKRVIMFVTKEAVRLGLPGYAEGIECAGCPPVGELMTSFADAGGELRLSDLFQRSEARGERIAPAREARRRNPALRVDRRGERNGLLALERVENRGASLPIGFRLGSAREIDCRRAALSAG
jgi:predicted peroxiredoxin